MPISINGNGTITGDAAFVGNVSATGTHTLVQVPNYRNTPNISANYTVTTSYNELSVGPININNGVTVEIDDGANWVIV
jgi:hypothetical protein